MTLPANFSLAGFSLRYIEPPDLPYSEDLLQYLAYNNKPLKGIIIDELLPSALRTSNSSLHQPRESVTSMGNIKLPVEILRMVLLAMPYEGLVAFMAVNSAAFNLVTAIAEFRILNKYGGNVLRMLSKVHLHNCFSTADVYEVFTSPSCSYCLSFGAYVFLPGLVRCCQNCAERDYRLIPIIKGNAQKKVDDAGFNLTSQMVANLPVMTTIPGNYAASSSEPAGISKYKKQMHLLSRPLAEAAMIKAVVRNDPKARVPEIAHNPAWYWSRLAKVQRSMALAPMPYFDKETKSIQEGFRCRGCCNPFQNPHKCTDDCYIPNIPIDPRVSEQNRTEYTGAVGPAHVCVAKKKYSMEYLRRDFEQHYQQCNGARDFCKKFACIIPTWERDIGPASHMGVHEMNIAVMKCLITAAREKVLAPL